MRHSPPAVANPLQHPSGSANQAFYQAIARLCRSDRHLAASLREVRAGGENAQTLVLEAVPGASDLVYKKLPKIVRLIVLSGASFQAIAIDGSSSKVDQLLRLWPSLARPNGLYDKKAKMEQANQVARRYRALLGYAASRATIFVISTAGVYLDVHIHEGVTSLIAPEDMIGRSISDVLPSEHLETALRIILEIKQAYIEGARRTVTYQIWDRKYKSEIVPVSGADEVVLICERIT